MTNSKFFLFFFVKLNLFFTFVLYVFFSLKAMKTVIILSVLALVFVYPVQAQVVVTGHISAEVVDAASISTQPVTSFNISKSPDLAAEMDFDSYVLGKYTIYTGTDVTHNVLLTPPSISNSEGDRMTLAVSLKDEMGDNSETLAEQQHAERGQKLQLIGNVTDLQEQNSGLYQGSYTVTLIYN